MQRHVAIFIDWENIEIAVKQTYGGIILFEEFVQIIKKVNQDRIISGIFAYGDFDKGEAGLQTKLVRLGIEPKHVVTKTNHEYVKGAADLELSLDIMQLMYENSHITDFMIVSGDGDMLHVMKRLRLKGKALHILSYKANTSQLMLETADTFEDLTPFNDQFTRKVTKSEMEKRVQAALKDEWVQKVLNQLSYYQKNGNKAFIGLNFFRKKLQERFLNIPVSEALTECLDVKLIVTYSVENPHDPNNPTTACTVNPEFEHILTNLERSE